MRREERLGEKATRCEDRIRWMYEGKGGWNQR